jgi:phosphoenolpyruvate carboxykinase (ATP)
MEIQYTRALIRAALEGELDQVEVRQEPVFGLHVPQSCPGVPPGILNPRDTWEDPRLYDEKGRELAGLFRKNFESFVDTVDEAVIQAGPRAV